MRLRLGVISFVCGAALCLPAASFGQGAYTEQPQPDGPGYGQSYANGPGNGQGQGQYQGQDQYQDQGQGYGYGQGNGRGYGYGPGQENAGQIQPGMVNYVEGAAFLPGRRLNRRSRVAMRPGEMLTTQAGRVEILLTPGIFLRVGDNSAVRMVNPGLMNTDVELVRGHISVEVDQIFPQNNVRIVDAGSATQLLKPGYYEFNTGGTAGISAAVDVFSGEAAVQLGDGRARTVKSHHEFVLPARAGEKAVGFHPENVHSDLYNWSALRSEYLAEANNRIAGGYYGAGFYPGWYWDPYAWEYTYLGLYPFWSPFGYGFWPYGFYGGWYGGWGGYRGGWGGYRGGGYGGAGGFHGGGGGGRR